MAKIHEEIIVIKVSRLYRDSDTDVAQILNEDSMASIEVVIQELSGASTLVEIAKE